NAMKTSARPWNLRTPAMVRWVLVVCCVVLVQRACASETRPPGHFIILVDPANSISFSLLHGPQNAETSIGHISMAGWGPKWAWAGIHSGDKPQGPFVVSAPFVVNKGAKQTIAVQLHVTQTDKRSVAFQYDLSAETDVPLTMLAATVGFNKSSGGAFVATGSGKPAELKLPLSRGAVNEVTHAEFKLNGAGNVGIGIDPASDIGIDGDARFLLAHDKFAAGHKTITLTFTFADDVTLVISPADVAKYVKPLATADWFAFTPGNDLSASVIGMENWLERPAGKRGGVRMAGDPFQLKDGSPIKFWGTNLAYGSSCAPEKKIADFTAARFAKFG